MKEQINPPLLLSHRHLEEKVSYFSGSEVQDVPQRGGPQTPYKDFYFRQRLRKVDFATVVVGHYEEVTVL